MNSSLQSGDDRSKEDRSSDRQVRGEVDGAAAPSGRDESNDGLKSGSSHGSNSGSSDGVDEASAGESPVNYEEVALLELEIDDTDYRLDVGRAGTALCISTRPSGSWAWVFRGEAKWQNAVLRCKAFDRSVLSQLSAALAEAAADSQS